MKDREREREKRGGLRGTESAREERVGGPTVVQEKERGRESEIGTVRTVL